MSGCRRVGTQSSWHTESNILQSPRRLSSHSMTSRPSSRNFWFQERSSKYCAPAISATKETYDYLRTISPDVHIAKGDYDESSFPSSVTVSMHNPIRIGWAPI